jgi:hypothetical protein
MIWGVRVPWSVLAGNKPWQSSFRAAGHEYRVIRVGELR